MFRLLDLFFLFALLACGSSPENPPSSSPPDPDQMAKGFNLLEQQCFACHSPDARMANQPAPPIEEIKRYYLGDGSSLVTFQEELTRFVQHPDESYSKMPAAIQRFGLMPAMPLSTDQLAAIATYIYRTELEAADWFEEHYQQEQLRYRQTSAQHDQTDDPLSLARQYALATKSQLGSNLLQAINEGGPAHAVDFCHTRAIPLTDSMSNLQGARIRRISDRPRNPDNAATEDEAAIINDLKSRLAAQEKNIAHLEETDEHYQAFLPIVTNDMCLHCHGDPQKDIQPTTLQTILDRYPNDQATGYAANQLRGVWVVELSKK